MAWGYLGFRFRAYGALPVIKFSERTRALQARATEGRSHKTHTFQTKRKKERKRGDNGKRHRSHSY
eukprot:scaffold7934_cov59-Attheya_sp.AAC.7